MSVPMADVMEISWAGSHEESEWAYSYARQLLSNDGIRLQLIIIVITSWLVDTRRQETAASQAAGLGAATLCILGRNSSHFTQHHALPP
eukprot:scaffold1010_cov20-Tisochrysis_lutea.AAC.1